MMIHEQYEDINCLLEVVVERERQRTSLKTVLAGGRDTSLPCPFFWYAHQLTSLYRLIKRDIVWCMIFTEPLAYSGDNYNLLRAIGRLVHIQQVASLWIPITSWQFKQKHIETRTNSVPTGKNQSINWIESRFIFYKNVSV